MGCKKDGIKQVSRMGEKNDGCGIEKRRRR
jgi:hypothetical protein